MVFSNKGMVQTDPPQLWSNTIFFTFCLDPSIKEKLLSNWIILLCTRNVDICG